MIWVVWMLSSTIMWVTWPSVIMVLMWYNAPALGSLLFDTAGFVVRCLTGGRVTGFPATVGLFASSCGSHISGGGDKGRNGMTHKMGLPFWVPPGDIPYPLIPSNYCRPYMLWPTSLG